MAALRSVKDWDSAGYRAKIAAESASGAQPLMQTQTTALQGAPL